MHWCVGGKTNGRKGEECAFLPWVYASVTEGNAEIGAYTKTGRWLSSRSLSKVVLEIWVIIGAVFFT